ncbi:endonuclease/exonuclease/phosphatase family protein [Roseimaritima ulvae]|uniref:Endonuclease/exonuclease/phosphatase domain-containing protein n=1 Tax=Roseimaritima ulvae TaxID=980254 RepID=A0A5B9QXF5_9BACT|nr:endonuclease/exonuclease/phosphatase family protein [Roseimaritima ulvae]QEG43744.1 hypothetical protein UC8_57980 [Roseimaritima ulvae]
MEDSPAEVTVASGRWRLFLHRLAGGVTVGLLLAAGVYRVRSWHWAADLTTHMQAHLLVAAIGVSVWFLITRRWRWALLGLVLVGQGVWTVEPWEFWGPRPTVEAADTRPLRIAVWNTFVGNPDSRSIVQFAAESDADVVAILEWSEAVGQGLEELRASHPHYQEVPFGGAFGIALYSRIPGTLDLMTLPGPVPALRFRPHDERLPVDLWAVHTLPPMGRKYHEIRNQQLAAVGQQVRDDANRLPIVCGDLNITPWADPYRQLLLDADLVDSRRGFGYAATWPSRLGWFGIPIDQVAIDGRIGVTERTVQFASSGSDHAAVTVELKVPVEVR